MPDFTSLVYVKPYCRISPYLVGMGLGYLLHLQKGSTKKPHWVRRNSVGQLRQNCTLNVTKKYKWPILVVSNIENLDYGERNLDSVITATCYAV